MLLIPNMGEQGKYQSYKPETKQPQQASMLTDHQSNANNTPNEPGNYITHRTTGHTH